MTTKIQSLDPYLHFSGNCKEAIEFYKKALGAEVIMMMEFKDMPPEAKAQCPQHPPDNNVMHARLRIGNRNVMMSDGNPPGSPSFASFALNITAANPADAETLFKAISEGGNVKMPLAKTFFSPAFGAVTDRFGVSWMVYVEGGAPK